MYILVMQKLTQTIDTCLEHSFGGIIKIDLLIQAPRKSVKGLFVVLSLMSKGGSRWLPADTKQAGTNLIGRYTIKPQIGLR
jgi:hypothetical protein